MQWREENPVGLGSSPGFSSPWLYDLDKARNSSECHLWMGNNTFQGFDLIQWLERNGIQHV